LLTRDDQDGFPMGNALDHLAIGDRSGLAAPAEPAIA
jgi:hypothetical protein